jgi:hypothetical protein
MECEFSLQHPFTAIVVGPTGCGKTRLAAEIVKNSSVTICPPPEKIVWCYSELQPTLHRELAENVSLGVDLHFCKGIPDWNRLFPHEDHMLNSLVVIDDFMTEVGDNKRQTRAQAAAAGAANIVSLFTKGSHHRNLSVLFLCQNLYYRGGQNYMRDVNLNTQYIFAFKNPRDRTQITHLARQMAPKDWRRVHDNYECATKEAHQYLLFDVKQMTDDPLRYRTNFVWGACNGCAVIYGPEDFESMLALLNGDDVTIQHHIDRRHSHY